MKNLTTTTAIELVNQSTGSLFTKQDVIDILNRIEDKPTQQEIDFSKFKELLFEEFGNTCWDEDIVDKDSADFSLSWKEIQLDSVEIDEHALRSKFKGLVDDAISNYKEYLTEQEEEEDENTLEIPTEIQSFS
jgi:hypothetical protein